MANERLVTPVRHDRGLGMKPTLDECGQRGDDVRVRVRADEPTQVLDTDDLVDLAHDLGSVEGRTGIDQHRLVALFHEVNVALELISRKQRTHPPDPWGQFDGARGVEGHDAHLRILLSARSARGFAT